jgi:GT2 family glycosyltransferase
LSIAVIIPAYNSAETLAETLRAIKCSARVPDELWVVDDASTDRSAAVAKAFGACVLSMAKNAGPSACRNQAALLVKSSILVFLDADTWVHPATIQRLEAHMVADPDLAAVIGAYDDAPHHRGAVSQCRNLAHCYVHRAGLSRALTFWSGCGAVRRDVFLELGGFNERYRRPSIEDIEFGYHMTGAGKRILLDSSIVVKHAKHWTIANAVVTDIRDRGIPWVALLLERGQMPNDLNISMKNRVSTGMVGVALLCLLGGIHFRLLLAVSSVLLLSAVLLHTGMFRFIGRKRPALLPVSIILFLLVEVCNLVALAGGAAVSVFGPIHAGRTSCILSERGERSA